RCWSETPAIARRATSSRVCATSCSRWRARPSRPGRSMGTRHTPFARSRSIADESSRCSSGSSWSRRSSFSVPAPSVWLRAKRQRPGGRRWRRAPSALVEVVWDLVVVGGGIYGAAIAREAALRGLSVALVDRGDFGAATSANSHKIIHGGLRYLQHLDLPRLR